MNAPCLPVFLLEDSIALPAQPARSRASRIVEAWLEWRRRRITLERGLEISAFATFLCAWGLLYCLLCQMEPHPRPHHHAAPTFVVLR